MEEIKEFDQSWYNDKYFADKQGKGFKQPDGSVKYWGYKNPDGDYVGADHIAQAWKTIFRPQIMLDFGCGRGTFLAYTHELGILSFGFDYSLWAIQNPHPRAPIACLLVHDATKKWPYANMEFDLVMGTDILEHIYEDDINFVIDEMYRVSRRWVFLQIPVVDGVREKGYILKRGERIPFEDGRTWAGHVTVADKTFWESKLERDDWQERRDMVNWFCSLVDPAYIKNWLVNMLYIAERTA